MVAMFSLSLMIAEHTDLLSFVVGFICMKIFVTLAFMVGFWHIYRRCIRIRRRFVRPSLGGEARGSFLVQVGLGPLCLGFLALMRFIGLITLGSI